MSDLVTLPNSADAGERQRGFDLLETLSFIWRQWKFIGAIATISFLIGVIFLLQETPLYTATSQVLLNAQQEKAAGAEKILTDADLDMAMIESQMAIIRSTVLLRRVVEKEHLVAPPPPDNKAPEPDSQDPSILKTVLRSEERRVGKEC